MKLLELWDMASIEYRTQTPHNDLAKRSEAENFQYAFRLFLKYVEIRLSEMSKF